MRAKKSIKFAYEMYAELNIKFSYTSNRYISKTVFLFSELVLRIKLILFVFEVIIKYREQ